MLTLQLDGRIVDAHEGQSLLDVAHDNDVEIPTLCNHAGLENHGACRLCMVEITKDGWGDWSRLVTACEYPAEDGLVVSTATDKVLASRRAVLDLLLARCPDTPKVRELARAHGIAKTSFVPREEPDDCILCAICVRTCAAGGAHAITTSGRGTEKVVGPPVGAHGDYDATDCVGCLSCAYLCPTNHIGFSQTETTRTIWGRTFDLVACDVCGRTLGTPEQLDHFAAKSGLPRESLNRCDVCRKQDTAKAFHAVIA